MSNIGDAIHISCNANHISFLRFRLSSDRTPKEDLVFRRNCNCHKCAYIHGKIVIAYTAIFFT